MKRPSANSASASSNCLPLAAIGTVRERRQSILRDGVVGVKERVPRHRLCGRELGDLPQLGRGVERPAGFRIGAGEEAPGTRCWRVAPRSPAAAGARPCPVSRAPDSWSRGTVAPGPASASASWRARAARSPRPRVQPWPAPSRDSSTVPVRQGAAAAVRDRYVQRPRTCPRSWPGSRPGCRRRDPQPVAELAR